MKQTLVPLALLAVLLLALLVIGGSLWVGSEEGHQAPEVAPTATPTLVPVSTNILCQSGSWSRNVMRCVDFDLLVACYYLVPDISDDGGRAISCLPIREDLTIQLRRVLDESKGE